MKELMEEGHTVRCFDRYEREGGVFYYSPHKGGVYDSTVLTISNYHMAFSSFPPVASEPRYYWSRSEYAHYLRRFAFQFGLFEHIQFNTEVAEIAKGADGRYALTLRQGDGTSEVQYFDAVAVCSGSNQHTNWPKFPGQEQFEGEIIHSQSYKRPDPFTGKRVLVVGLGETGSDVAHEVSSVAKSCMISVRRNHILVDRWFFGTTNDADSTRWIYTVKVDTINAIVIEEKNRELERPAPDTLPAHQFFNEWNDRGGNTVNEFFTKCPAFLQDVVEKRLSYNVGGIERLEGNRVVFKDGNSFEADTIICCTGYQTKFDFFHEDLDQPDLNNPRHLFKHMIHPELGSDIAFIGFARPAAGGQPAISEMQARYFALLTSGKRQLPPVSELKDRIARDRQVEEALFCNNPNLKTVVYYGTFMDELGELVGCKPKLWSFDLGLMYRLWFGTQFSYQYRLRGPGANPAMAKQVLKSVPVPFPMSYAAKLVLELLRDKIADLGGPLQRLGRKVPKTLTQQRQEPVSSH